MVRLVPGRCEWREIAGEVVVLDVATMRYLAINRTGATLWPAIAEGATPAELEQRLIAVYGIEPAAAAHDVRAFLDWLAAEGLTEDG